MYESTQPIASDIEGYLKAHENKELLRFITCGSVDDGKSTLIGRLLHDSKTIFEDQLEALSRDSKKSGTTGEKIDLALLVDGLQSEREQGITIDVAYRYFTTEKRKFIIADTPGHEQYTRNMATGASTADLAIILIDARHGVSTQTRRHSYIVRLLGIRNIIVAINKMDLVDYGQWAYSKIECEYRIFAEEIGIDHITVIPISALEGDNIVEPSGNMPWYEGPTLLQLLEEAPIETFRGSDPFRMVVQYVNRPHLDFRGFAGSVASGSIRVGDRVKVLPSGKSTTLKSIVTYDGNYDSATAGQAVTLTFADEIDISRGDVIVSQDDMTVLESSVIEAYLVWMDESVLEPNRTYWLKRSSTMNGGYIDSIEYRIDVNTQRHHEADSLGLNDIALVRIVLGDTLAFDPYETNRETGSFILIDKITNNTVAAGMIKGGAAMRNSDEHRQTLEFEIELNALIRRHFPHWNAAVIR